jgi:hypothetical protein
MADEGKIHPLVWVGVAIGAVYLLSKSSAGTALGIGNTPITTGTENTAKRGAAETVTNTSGTNLAALDNYLTGLFNNLKQQLAGKSSGGTSGGGSSGGGSGGGSGGKNPTASNAASTASTASMDDTGSDAGDSLANSTTDSGGDTDLGGDSLFSGGGDSLPSIGDLIGGDSGDSGDDEDFEDDDAGS